MSNAEHPNSPPVAPAGDADQRQPRGAAEPAPTAEGGDRRAVDRRRFLTGALGVAGTAGLVAAGLAVRGGATDGFGVGAAAGSTTPKPGPFRSEPDLRPPGIHVATPAPKRSPDTSVFTDVHAGTGQQGALIISGRGDLQYFDPVSEHGGNGRRIFNVRVQEYGGEPVMTYWQGAMVSGHLMPIIFIY